MRMVAWKRLGLLLVIGAAWLWPVAPVSAAPEISGVSMRYCGSLRIPEYGWAYLYYDVRNPDPEPANLRLVLRPQGQVNITIYEHLIKLPGNARYKSRVPVTIGSEEAYTVSLFRDGHLIDSEELLLSVPAREAEKRLQQARERNEDEDELARGIAGGNERFVFFLNDNFDLSYGNFAKNKELHFKYLTSAVRAEDIPDHFAGFGSAHMLVIQEPDFAAWSNRQINAVQDYVARGGAVIFASPKGLMDAWENSTLRRLIPVEPLRMRALETTDALEAVGGERLTWPEGVDFLESAPAGNGITTLTHEGFPVVRWQRYGLGYVGACAFNPSDQTLQQSESFAKLWNHIFSFGGNNTFATGKGDHQIAKALDTITGVKIPRATHIQLFLLGYMALVVLFIGGGMLTRMRMQAWMGLGIIAIATTMLIFHFANRRAATLSNRTAALLDFRVEGVHDQSGEELVSIFLKQEETLSLRSADVDSYMRSLISPPRDLTAGERQLWAQAAPDGELDEELPPAINPIVSRGGATAVRDPLRISLISGRAHLNDLKVLQQMPRFYGVLYSRSALPEWQLPIITWGADGPNMERWPIPTGMVNQDAYLVCENGYYNVSISNGEAYIEPGSQSAGFMEAPPEIVAIRSFLSRRAVPAPMVVLIGAIGHDPADVLDDSFEVLGRRISLVPIIENRTASEGTVAFRRSQLQTGRRSRLLMQDGIWQPESSLRGDDTKDYDFHAYLPPGYNRIAPATVRIRFNADNRGKNVQFTVFLVDPSAPEDAERRIIEPSHVDDDIYSFTELPSSLIDPTSGRIAFYIRASTMQSVSDPNLSARMNTWIIRDLDLAVEGTLPPETRGNF